VRRLPRWVRVLAAAALLAANGVYRFRDGVEDLVLSSIGIVGSLLVFDFFVVDRRPFLSPVGLAVREPPADATRDELLDIAADAIRGAHPDADETRVRELSGVAVDDYLERMAGTPPADRPSILFAAIWRVVAPR
jgi:hypothetical protein